MTTTNIVKEEQDPKSLSDVSIHDQLVDNPVPFDEAKEVINEQAQKPVDKKIHELDDEELVRHLGKVQLFRFLTIDEDGNYGYIERKRRSLNTRQIEDITELGQAAVNFKNIPKKFNREHGSVYFNSQYYERDDLKFYSQNTLIDYYFKKIVHLSFGIPYSEMETFAIDDDPDEMDKNNAFCVRTIAKAVIQIGNYGWAYFRQG